MGMASFADNQFAERIALYFTEPSLRDCQHRFYEEVPFEFIAKFTGLQFLACAIIFGVTLTPAAVVFPVLIGILIPLRLQALTRYMDKTFVASVDPYEAEDDSTEGSVDEAEHSEEIGVADVDAVVEGAGVGMDIAMTRSERNQGHVGIEDAKYHAASNKDSLSLSAIANGDGSNGHVL